MKLIDILNLISKGELKEGTKIKYHDGFYIYRRFDNEEECMGFYRDNATDKLDELFTYYLRLFYASAILNDEVELIEAEENTTEKIEELDIDSTTWNDLYIEQKLDILFEKQNEVIRRINNERL